MQTATQKQKLYVHVQSYTDTLTKDTPIHVFSNDMSEYSYVLIHTVEIDVEYPLVDLLSLKLESLKKQEERIRAEFYKRLGEIHEQVSRLQAISYKPEVVTDEAPFDGCGVGLPEEPKAPTTTDIEDVEWDQPC